MGTDELGNLGICRRQRHAIFSKTTNYNVQHDGQEWIKINFDTGSATPLLVQQVVIPQERNSERITEQTVDVPVPHVTEGIVESEFVAPALAVARKRRTVKSVACLPVLTRRLLQ